MFCLQAQGGDGEGDSYGIFPFFLQIFSASLSLWLVFFFSFYFILLRVSLAEQILNFNEVQFTNFFFT